MKAKNITYNMKHIKIYESNRDERIKRRKRMLKGLADVDNIDNNLLYTIYLNDDGTAKLLNSKTTQFDFEFDNIDQLCEELKNIDMSIQSKKYNI